MNSLTSPSPSSNTQSFQRRNSYSRGPTPRTNYQSSNYASPGQNNDVYLSPRSDLNTISPSRRTSRKDNSDSDSMPPRGSRHLSLTPSSPNLILTKNPNIRSESTFARRRSVKSGQQEDVRHSPKMKITSVTSYTPSSRPPSINNHYQNNDYNSGSDSGIRENSDCVSPRSPDYKLSSDVVPSKNVYTQTQAYSQIVSSQVTTLAMVAENFAELSLSAYPEQRKISKDFLSRLSFYQINFKYSSPVIIKGSILISDAEISTGYGKGDIRVSVMITPAAHYSPLMGRHAEVSGFGPVILTEFEESQQAVSGFLNSCGVYSKQASAYKITLMPAQICCSFHTLSAQFLHYSSKSINPSKYEEHVCFIVLQLLTALKYLQSDGVEMLSSNFREFLITYHHSDLTECLQTFDHLPRLFLLKEAIGNNEEEGMSVGMCKYATRALYTLLNHKMHSSLPLILERSEFSYPLKKCAELLSMDKSSSLSEAKSVLELAFFVGPTQFNSENEAKIWLDTNRANLLNRVLFLMMSKKENFLDLKEKMHIQFLLSSTPRNLCQSLRLLSKHNTTPPLQDSEC
uniref:Mab-21 domain-containing protein n=1 Tax=Rhabditophanes sp. KR3021 TaxID=114890 RepID=A0AC35U0V3_9BILA